MAVMGGSPSCDPASVFYDRETCDALLGATPHQGPNWWVYFLIGLAAVIVVVLIVRSFRIVKQYERGVVYRLGRIVGPERQPGPSATSVLNRILSSWSIPGTAMWPPRPRPVRSPAARPDQTPTLPRLLQEPGTPPDLVVGGVLCFFGVVSEVDMGSIRIVLQI
jgi:hypothetical protein